MTVKVTLQFAARSYRWSESHYAPGLNFVAGELGSSQPAAAPALALATARAALLGYGASIYNIRISGVPANRIVADLPQAQGLAGKWMTPDPGTPADEGADFPDTAVMVSLNSAQGTKRMWLACPPDFVCEQNAATGVPFDYNGGFDAQWTQLLNAWLTLMTGGVWGYRSLKTSVPIPVITLVQGIGSPALAGLTTSAPIGAGVGSEVLVRGFRRSNTRLPSLSGIYQVAQVLNTGAPSTAVTYYLSETGNVSIGNFPTLGTIAIPLPTYPLYASGSPSRIGRRKRGAPSDRVRGRSSVR